MRVQIRNCLRPLLRGLALFSCLVGISAGNAEAQTRRINLNLHGDMTMFGNTLGHDCRTAIPAPIVGNVGTCGALAANNDDSSIDVYWTSDTPLNGATANNTNTAANARSTAVLQLPQGASVVYARLYWSGETAAAADTQAVIERPGVSAPLTVTQDDTATVTNNAQTFYQSTSDITSFVQRYGAGAYRVSGVATLDRRDANQNVTWANWSVVVVYQDNRLPARNLTIFDSMAAADGTATINAAIDGFLVPMAGFDGKLGYVAYDGDTGQVGDGIAFNGTALSNDLNPANDVINATRSYFGNAVTVPGDLPQYSGARGSMNGIDLDIFDITQQLTPGMKLANIRITGAASERVFAGVYWTAISTLFPIFSDTTKTWVNQNRSDGTVQPGDVVEYTIVTSNTGSDTGTNVVLTDPLPTQLTYVPGSLTINGVAKTDAPTDDEAGVTTTGGVTTITARLGQGASGTTGGTVRVGDAPSVIKFRVTINAGVNGNVLNQATVSSRGERAVTQGVTTSATWNSGDGRDPAVPTVFAVGLPTDLRVTIRDNLNGQVPPQGGNIIYTVTVTNGGPNPVTNGSLDNVLPNGATGASWTCAPTGAGATCPMNAGTGSISTNMLNLPANGELTYTITVPVGTAPNDVLNPSSTITVRPPAGVADTNPGNNFARTGVSDLAITVSDNLNGMQPQPNMDIIYTVQVTNAGPSAAQSVILSDTLPAGVVGTGWTCVAAMGAACPAGGSGTGGLPQNGGTVPMGGTLTYTVRIPGTATPVTDAGYSVGVNAPQPLVDPSLFNNVAATARTDLRVTITDNLANMLPTAGANVRYTITVTNDGPQAANGASLANVLPAGILNVAWTCVGSSGAACPQGGAAAGVPNLSGLNLPRNGTLTFTVTGQAPATVPAQWNYTTTISPPPGVTDPNLANNTASVGIGGPGGPMSDLAIRITKSPQSAQPGEVTTYTVDVSNGGPAAVQKPTVVLTLPQGVAIVMEAAGDGWTCSKSDSTYTCSRPEVAAGNAPPIIAQITTPPSPADGGPAPTVLGLVGAPSANDPNPSNNLAVVDASAAPVRNSDLSLTITKSPNPSALGSETTYTLQLTNKGPDTALAPLINFSLPPSSTVTMFTPGQGWSCVQSGLSFTCVRADAPQGDAPPVVIKVITPVPLDGGMNAGAVVGEATSVQGRDPDPLNNSASVNAGNTPASGADLSVRLTRSPETPDEGGQVAYTLVATNQGPGNAENVVVTLTVPTGSEIISTDFGDWRCQQNLYTFICSRPRLAPGDAPSVVVNVKLPPIGPNDVMPGVGGGVATVNAANNSDPDSSNNVSTLPGIGYQLNGGGFSCDCSMNGNGNGTSAPLFALFLSGLLFAALEMRRRRRHA